MNKALTNIVRPILAILGLALCTPSHAAWVFQTIGTPALRSSFTMAVPVASGITAGDDLFIYAGCRPGGGVAGSVNTPAGWTSVISMNSNPTSIGGALFWKKAVGGETTQSVTTTISAINCAGVMMRFTGGPASGLTPHATATLYSDGQQDISTPTLTISSPNALVFTLAARSWNDDSAGVTSWPGGSTTRLSYGTAIGSNEFSLLIGSLVQTTATTITAGTVDLVSTASLRNNVMMVALLPAATAPTFSTPPAVGTRTASSIPITATTACADCTFYGVAVVDGSGAPTCTQVKAGQNASSTAAYKSFSQALTASVQGTGTFSTYTDGTIRDSYYCLNSTANGDSSVASLLDIYKLPAYTVSPFVSARSATTHTVTATPDGAGTRYAVGCYFGSSTPSPANVVAGQCSGAVTALTANSKAVTGNDTVVLTYSAPLLVYSVFEVTRYGGQDSVVQLMATEIAGGAAGYTAPAALTSACSDTACPVAAYNAKYATDIATADWFSCLTDTVPDGFDITWGLDGAYTYPDPSASRQSFDCKYYDTSAFGMFAQANPATFFVNNSPPVCSGTDALPLVMRFKSGLAITPITTSVNCSDPDGDGLTAAVTEGTLQPSLVLNSGTTVLSGTPSGEVEIGVPVVLTFTDPALDSAESVLNVGVAITLTIPSFAGLTGEAYATLVETPLWLNAVASYSYDATVAAGNVISVSPTVGTEVEPFTNVDYVVSLGAIGAAPTVNGYLLTVDPDMATVLYAVSVKRHATAPNCAQIQAGTDGAGNVGLGSGAAVSTAGEQVMIAINGITVPKTDVYVVGVASSVCSPVYPQLNLLKTAPGGSQYIEIK